MISEVEFLNSTNDEYALGRIAHFTHEPIGSDLNLKPSVPGDKEDLRFVQVAVNCLKLGHMSVFEFADVLFRVKCPIYVARQLVRHRNGVFMEKSLRCLEAPDVMSVAPQFRGHYAYDLGVYKTLVAAGVRKEQARAVLPLCTPTEFLWRISLRSLFNVFDQRLAPTAQEETREVVQQMFDHTEAEYPNLLAAWKESR